MRYWDKILLAFATWTNPEGIRRSEISQTGKDKKMCGPAQPRSPESADSQRQEGEWQVLVGGEGQSSAGCRVSAVRSRESGGGWRWRLHGYMKACDAT